MDIGNPARKSSLPGGDMDQMVPVSLMLIGMPVSGSIGHAIGLAMISYTVIKVFSGKAKEVSAIHYKYITKEGDCLC